MTEEECVSGSRELWQPRGRWSGARYEAGRAEETANARLAQTTEVEGPVQSAQPRRALQNGRKSLIAAF